MNKIIILDVDTPDNTMIDFGIEVIDVKDGGASLLRQEGPCLLDTTESGRMILFPYNMSYEIYYAINDGVFYLSKDLVGLAKKFGANVYDEQVEKMGTNWTCDTGFTIFSGIRRVLPGDVLKLSDLTFSRKEVSDYQQSKPLVYSEFKDAVTKSVGGLVTSDDKVGVLFSGGADSLLICLTLEMLNIPFSCYTAFPKQEFDGALSDKFKAEAMASAFGWKLKLVEVDFDSYEISDLDGLVLNMPQSVHLGLYFKVLTESAKSDGITVLFSGQNMDSLYNLGPTSPLSFSKSSIADFIRRVFLNSSYFKTLQGRGLLGNSKKYFAVVPALVFSLVYSLFRRRLFRPALSSEEAIKAYQSSTDYSTFVAVGSNMKTVKVVSSRGEIKTSLLDYKVENFLMTGAPQAIHSSCRSQGIRSALPFSTSLMLKAFYRLPLKGWDVFFPKYFVYKAIKEYSGKSYSKVWSESTRGRTSGYVGVDYQGWCKDILPNTTFGRSLYNSVVADELTGSTPAQQLMDLLARYWIKLQVGKLND